MDYSNIFIDGICLNVHVGGWSGASELTPEDLGLSASDVADMFSLGKKALIPIEISKAFKQIENKGRNLVKKNSHTFTEFAANFVPRTKFGEVVNGLTACHDEYMALADDLEANYESYKDEMRPRWKDTAEQVFERINPDLLELGPEDDPEEKFIKREQDKEIFVETFLARVFSQYPAATSLRERFYYRWSQYQIAAPEMLLTTVEEVLQTEESRKAAAAEAKRQTDEKIGAFVAEVATKMRQETSSVCNRISTAIKNGKVIHGNTIDSLRNFIDRFKTMNFVGDEAISVQLDAVKTQFLDAYGNEDLSKNLDLQTELAEALTQITAEASKITEQDVGQITGRYARRVNWEE